MIPSHALLFAAPPPVLDLDFLAGDTLPAAVTFSRASGGTRITSAQLLETVSNNIGRIDYDLATGQRLGFMDEMNGATNSCLWSRDLSNAAWVKSNCTATLGAEGVTGSWSSQVYGPELITNGDFSNGLTGWDAQPATGCTSFVSSGVLKTVSSGATGWAYGRYQNVTVLPGRTYIVSASCRVAAGTELAFLRLGHGSGQLGDTRYDKSTTSTSFTTLSTVITATSSEITVYLRQTTSSDASCEFDNVSVCEVVRGFGPELVTNGTFNADLSGWTDASTAPSTVSWSNGEASFNVSGGNSSRLRQSITTVAGKTYFVIRGGTIAAGACFIGSTTGAGDILSSIPTTGAFFTASSTTTWVNFATGASATLDNISVREIINGAASTITASANNALIRQAITKAAHTGVFSAYARRRTGSGAVSMFGGELGPELVTNGTFNTDLSGWTDASTAPSTVSWSNGEASFNVSGGNAARLRQSITTVIGRTYFVIRGGTIGANSCFIGTGAGLGDILSNVPTTGAFFTATGTTTWVSFPTGASATLDNISVKELVETPITLTSSWQRFSTTPASLTNPIVGFKLATNGDAIDVDYCQEESNLLTSPIATTSATADRSADVATITLNQSCDILVQDRAGGAWIDAQAAGTYTLAPRAGQRHIARLRAFPAGRINAARKLQMAVAA